MKNTIHATPKELAGYLFERKDKLPTVVFYAEYSKETGEKQWGYSVSVIDYADSKMVIGNYFGGGQPFCHDITDDVDASALEECLELWMSSVGCGDEVYL